MSTQYQILIEKLDDFIRKYYRNQIIRGSILISIVILLSWLLLSTIEFFGHFSVLTRTIIFYTSLAIFTAILIKFFIVPILHFLKIGKIISHEYAAQIISNHFSDIEDKLLNTLELANIKGSNNYSKELLFASIDQRIENIKPFPFPKAINVKLNYTYLKYLAGLAIVIIIILVSSPAVLTEGVQRIVNHRTYYEPAAPFHFILQNENLTVQKGDDFEIEVKLEGNYAPENVFISYGGNQFIMQKISNIEYKYKLKNINNSILFSFEAEDVESEKFDLKVLPTPVIIDYHVSIDVPEYTGEKDQILKNIGDLTVPAGSKLSWKFRTSDSDELKMTFSDSVEIVAKQDTGGLSINKTFFNSTIYAISLKNKYFTKNNLVKYSVNVVPDMHPGIKVNAYKDSSEHALFYFLGLINDDYGFNKLSFNYRSKESKDSLKSISIPIQAGSVSQEFYYAFDFSAINANPGNSVEYYFEVWDNDGVNGSKSSRSSIYEYNIPSEEELEKIEEETNKNIEEKLKESLELVDDLQKDINDLQENMINRDLSSWEKTKMIENISQKQNSLEQLMNEINELNEQKNDMMETFSEQEQEMVEKQQQIEELLENLMDEDLKKLMDELNELMKDFDKNKMNQLSDEMKMSYEDLSEQLDRNLEILKKYEIEKEIENTIDKLEELAEEQEQLSEEVKDKKANQDDLLKKQQEQESEFKKAMEEYKEAVKKNEELKSPMKLQDFEKDQEDINNEFKEGSESMQNGSKNKASKSQKQNSQNLKNMSASMQGMMQQNQAQQNSENMDDLRQIIENIVTFSFNQEELMETLKGMNRKDPKFMEIVSEQKKLEDNFTVIKDSLNALAQRTPMLSSAINKEVLSIEKDMERVLNLLEESRNNNINSSRSIQQYIMTSANNLALLLSEVLKQMQNQAMQQCSGNKNCSKPGKGKPKLSDMKSQQQSLKQQLESMIQQMKNAGNKPSKNAMNKRLSEMLAQQEIFNDQLSKLMQNGGFSPETMRKLNEIKKLTEQNENDIINKSITPETIKRQDLILTRLLQAENSEYQREIDNKRKSNEAKLEKFSNPKDFFKYKRLHSKYNELLNTSEIKFYKYYNEKYKQYMINLNEE